jgi:diamine N-acetyltransferase
MDWLTDNELMLRAPEMEDVEALYGLENEAEAWTTGCGTGPYSRFQLTEYVRANRNDLFADGQMRLMMVERATNRVVGCIDLLDFNARHSRAEVGVTVTADERKKGWASKALDLLTHHAFCALGIHQLYAYIAEDNTPCRALFKACGYRECANLHHWLRARGGFKDVVMVQMLNCAQD